MSHRLIRTPSALVVLLAALFAVLATPALSQAKIVFEIPGKGYGHGVGMSQWGAYGFAKQGRDHERILRHYYRGTRIGKADTEQVGVLLSVRSGAVRFSGAVRGCGSQLSPARTYTAELSRNGRKVRLESASGKKIRSCGGRLSATPEKKIEIEGDGTYRGKLVTRPDAGSLNVINRVPIEGYLKGVVPHEVPSSWPDAALRAQAVAARSYALSTRADGRGFELYDDTRSQVYGGAAAEVSSTNKAVRRTAGEVLKHKGDTITAYFFSSSGGRTENSEHGFAGGAERPYLRSVKDPFDSFSPYHRWQVTHTRKEMEAMLGDRVLGRLKNIKITKTGETPRIVEARVVGTAGSTTVTGPDLRFALGLRSTWAKFKKIRGR